MPPRTPDLAKRRSRLAGLAPATRHEPGVTSAPDRGPNDRRRSKAVPLASLPLPQRRLINALLEAAKAAAIRRAVAVDTLNLVAPGEIPGRRAGGGR